MPFLSCVTRVNSTVVEDAQDLDIVMLLYNLLYYSKKYRKTTGSLWNYYRDEPNSGAEENINYSIKDSESYSESYYKTGITGKLQNNEDNSENIEIAVPLKYISKSFRNLDIPLINSEVSLDLKWTKNCVLTSKATGQIDPDANPPVLAINSPANAEFPITDCKLYVPVVTLSVENENKLYEQLKKDLQ